MNPDDVMTQRDMRPRPTRGQTSVDGQTTLCVLAGGSRGNAICLASGRSAVLFDAGLSGREIEKRMRQRGLDPGALSAIVVSHEHIDHVRGVGVLARRYKLPVFMTNDTAQAAKSCIGPIPVHQPIESGRCFQVDGFTIHPFMVSHDAADPVGFTIAADGLRIGIATDLGVVTGLVAQCLQDCHFLVLEANHDERMLTDGPYPWPLKQRIRSRNGHLSNAATAELLRSLAHDNLRQVILSHLSETNNTPAIALETVRQCLGPDRRMRLAVAMQDRSSPVFRIDATAPRHAPPPSILRSDDQSK